MNTPLSPRNRRGIEKRGENVTPYADMNKKKCIQRLDEKEKPEINKTRGERIRENSKKELKRM